MLERHEHKFEYAGNPFTRVEIQYGGITHPGIGNLFRVGAVPGGFFRGLFGIKKEEVDVEEVKAGFKKALGNVKAILDGPYDKFTKTKSDPEAGVYEATYRTLHYGITPKATITVYGERRHHPEFAVEIQLNREETVVLEKKIDEKEREIKNIESKIKRLERQLVNIRSNIDKYFREQEAKKVELETEETDIQRVLLDKIDRGIL